MSILDLIHDAMFYDRALSNLDNQGNRKAVRDARASHRANRDKALDKVEKAKAKAKKYGRK